MHLCLSLFSLSSRAIFQSKKVQRLSALGLKVWSASKQMKGNVGLTSQMFKWKANEQLCSGCQLFWLVTSYKINVSVWHLFTSRCLQEQFPSKINLTNSLSPKEGQLSNISEINSNMRTHLCYRLKHPMTPQIYLLVTLSRTLTPCCKTHWTKLAKCI